MYGGGCSDSLLASGGDDEGGWTWVRLCSTVEEGGGVEGKGGTGGVGA